VTCREQLALVAAGGVLIDVSIDQGGCIETIRPTTDADAEPTHVVDGVRHGALTNLPATAVRTATRSLTNATLPYVRRPADLGATTAVDVDSGLRTGLNIVAKRIVHPAAAAAVSVAPAT
jgi:alanine dehydrogenase